MTRWGLALFALLAVTASSFAAAQHEDWANTDAVANQVMDSVFQELGRQLLQDAPGAEPAAPAEAAAAPAEPAAQPESTAEKMDSRGSEDGEPRRRHKKDRHDDFDEKKMFDKIKEYFTDALEYFKERTSGSKDKIAELAELQRKAVKDARESLEGRLGEARDKLGETGLGDRLGGLTDKVRIRLDDGRIGVSEFLENVLGKDYKDHVPDFLKGDSLDWRKLGGKDFDEHLADLAHDIDGFSFEKLEQELANGEVTLADVRANFQGVIARYCDAEKYSGPPTIVPTGCTGAAVAIQLVPRYCQLDDVQWQLVCEPPKLALQFFPVSCNLKYESSSLWQGKRCRVHGNIGSSRTAVVGGRTFNIVLADLSDADNFAQQLDMLTKPAKRFVKEGVDRLEERVHKEHEGDEDGGDGHREGGRKGVREEVKEHVQKGAEGVERVVKEGEERVKKALKHDKPEHREERAAPQ